MSEKASVPNAPATVPSGTFQRAPLPPFWSRVLVLVAGLWGGLITWQIQRGLDRLDRLATAVSSLDSRVAVLEERLPQPLGKELAPLVDNVEKLAVEVAELRGLLGGRAAPRQRPPRD